MRRDCGNCGVDKVQAFLNSLIKIDHSKAHPPNATEPPPTLESATLDWYAWETVKNDAGKNKTDKVSYTSTVSELIKKLVEEVFL